MSASVGAVTHGGETTGLGAMTDLYIKVQAASWIDVDSIDIVVDGVITTIDILPADAIMVGRAGTLDRNLVAWLY